MLGFNTDREIVAGIESERVCLIGSGGAARALLPALQRRRADLQPLGRLAARTPSGCDLVVNATPVRDELLVEPRRGQTVVDLAYRADGRPTALVAAALAAGCETIDGLEALVRQGAASFERWTGVAAPVDVMRAALHTG